MAEVASSKNYHLGLLYLCHILISADGVIHEEERQALLKITEKEKISPDVFDEFQQDTKTKKMSWIYQKGIELISGCSIEERKKGFVHLFELCAIDGSIHPKEVKLLLYSANLSQTDLNEIMAQVQVPPAS